MNILNNFYFRLLAGFLLFLIVGTISSCKVSEQSTIKYKALTPNTQHLNEGEWIKSKQVIKYHK